MRALSLLSIPLLFLCLNVRAQNPQGYWFSEDKIGFFDGLDNMEMRIDPAGLQYVGSVYYVWEHGLNYQAVSLDGRWLSKDSIEIRELSLVADRNARFHGDCLGVFRLHYSRDSTKEYLTGSWVRSPDSKSDCPSSQVTFFRIIPPNEPRPLPIVVSKRKSHIKTNDQATTTPEGSAPAGSTAASSAGSTGAPAGSAASMNLQQARSSGVASSSPQATSRPNASQVVTQALDPDSLRMVAYKSRHDSTEMIIPHKGDTARLELYDDGIIDHDRISLFMDGNMILKNYELLGHAKVLQIKLGHGTQNNVLSLFAENEGDIPPNTALMVIYLDDKRYEVRLSSDMLTNAKVIFTPVAP
jgi:hypothetical protein